MNSRHLGPPVAQPVPGLSDGAGSTNFLLSLFLALACYMTRLCRLSLVGQHLFDVDNRPDACKQLGDSL